MITELRTNDKSSPLTRLKSNTSETTPLVLMRNDSVLLQAIPGFYNLNRRHRFGLYRWNSIITSCSSFEFSSLLLQLCVESTLDVRARSTASGLSNFFHCKRRSVEPNSTTPILKGTHIMVWSPECWP